VAVLRALRRMVQAHLNDHCYPQFTTYTRGGLATTSRHRASLYLPLPGTSRVAAIESAFVL
jgi:hypothetical protein